MLKQEGEPKPEIYRQLTFRQVLNEVFPQTRGTKAADFSAGLFGAVKPLCTGLCPDESGLYVVDSTAQILYLPDKRGKVIPKVAQGLLNAVEQSYQPLNSLVKSALNALAEGPDLDINLNLRSDNKTAGEFSDKVVELRRQQADYLQTAAVRKGKGQEMAGRYYLSNGLELETKEIEIPVRDSLVNSTRPVFEYRLYSQNKPILKIHLGLIAKDWSAWMADSRSFGVLSSNKQQFVLPIPLEFPPDFSRPVNRAGFADSLKITLFAYNQRVLSEGDYYYSFSGLETGNEGIINEHAVGFLVSVLRMANLGLFSCNNEAIRKGNYLTRGGQSKISEIFGQIKEKGSIKDLSEPARQEIFNLCLLNCLVDTTSFLNIILDLGILDFFPRISGADGKSDQEVIDLVEEIKKADPAKIVDQLNEFSRLFSF